MASDQAMREGVVTCGELAGQVTGVIGLGLMGLPMALRLRAAGAQVVVWNRSTTALEEAGAAGCEVASDSGEAAERLGGGILVLMLWDGNTIRSVLGAPGGFLDRVAPGTLVIDMGTTDLGTTRWLKGTLEQRGASLLDAPVSGGQVGAREGTLSIFVGGSAEDFQRAEPVLRVLGRRITHVGESGAGQVTKIVNQVVVAETIVAVAEALLMAEAAGVDPGKVRDALRGGFAESRILELHGARMAAGSFEPGGRAVGQLKDVRLALALEQELGIKLPCLRLNEELWEGMVRAGMGELDHSGMHTYLKQGLVG
jgi:3-hydroxyisobutyrate dehydrogenase-like beta-hydroxyacid dehydrogenase